MTDLSHISGFDQHWIERKPTPVEITDTERLDFLGEYCEAVAYVAPTPTNIGHFVIQDCAGQITKEASFRDAIDSAAAKWKGVNGD